MDAGTAHLHDVAWPAELAAVRAQLRSCATTPSDGSGGGPRERMAADRGDSATSARWSCRSCASRCPPTREPCTRSLPPRRAGARIHRGRSALDVLGGQRLPALVARALPGVGRVPRRGRDSKSGGRVVFESEPGRPRPRPTRPISPTASCSRGVGPMMFFARLAPDGRPASRSELRAAATAGARPPAPATGGARDAHGQRDRDARRDGRAVDAHAHHEPRAGPLGPARAAPRRLARSRRGGVAPPQPDC